MDIKTQFAGDEQFTRLCRGDDEVDLIGLLLELAADAQPELNQQAERMAIYELSLEFRELLRPIIERLYAHRPALCAAFDSHQPCEIPLADDDEARPLLAAASAVFRHELGFVGDDEDYYQPANSYLPQVLKRRKGIPITLSLLFRELAARSGLPMYGVCTPGHFVLGYPTEEPLYVDAYSGGVLSQPKMRSKIEQVTGEPFWSDDVFLPAPHVAIAARVLRNLKGAYARAEDWRQALVVQRRLAALLPELAEEQRDLGLLLVREGHAWPALEILEPYVQQRPEEAQALEPFVRAARRMSVQWN